MKPHDLKKKTIKMKILVLKKSDSRFYSMMKGMGCEIHIALLHLKKVNFQNEPFIVKGPRGG